MKASDEPEAEADPDRGQQTAHDPIERLHVPVSSAVGLRRAKSLPARPHELDIYPPIPRRASTGGAEGPQDTAPLAPLATSTITPALAVRAGLIRRVVLGFGGLGCDTRFVLAVKLFLALGQLIAFSVVLGITAGQTCEKPLRTYLIVHIIRATLSYPLGFYASLLPPAPGRNDVDTPERRAAREARRVMGTPRWDARVKLLSDLLLILAIVWFVLGNVWAWNAPICRSASPGVWYSTLASLIIGYFYLAEVTLIVIAILFFLPLAVLILTATGYGNKKHDIGPLAQSDIDAIPIVLFKPAEEGASTSEEAPASKEAEVKPIESPSKSASPRKARFSRLLFPKKRRKGETSRGNEGQRRADGGALPYPLHALPENLSTCPICLCDFEEPSAAAVGEDGKPEYDLLRLLPACGHALHRDCLDPWLKTSGRCPVCQTPVKRSEAGKGKRHQAGDPDPPPGTNDAVVADDMAADAIV